MYLANGFAIVLVLFYVAAFAAYLLAVRLLADIIQMKGFSVENRWMLYFIGVFTTPIVLGIIAIAVPDRSKE
ncbi:MULTISPECIES: hypothetical protein [unclassified Collinsella]|uniref:hypothetical protein n=1 Tax=unclassified Collinsella TaxID=2637548 RepID=UPI00319DF1AD